MADSSRSVMGLDDGDHNPFFLQMEQACAEILTSAAKCGAESGETLQTAANLDGIIGRMRDSVEEIRGTEWQLQRIAINATIRAAHLGDAGDALNTIAEAMSHMDRDSIRDTEVAADALRSMDEAVHHAFDEPDQAGLDAKTQQLLDELRTAVSELHTSSETSCHRVNQIAALGSDLGREIQAVRAGLSAGRLFAQTVQSARDQLQRIASETEPVPQDAPDLAASLDLERLSGRYTMQAEREVHENLIRGSSVPAPDSAGQVASAPDGGDLGDNVELF
jgi:hypothetical protein